MEHTADAYIAAYGKTLEEAFENAAYATFEIMTDVKRVKPKIEDIIAVEGHDEQELLYNWIEALIVKFDITGHLYSRFKIACIEKINSDFRLKANVWGEPFDAERHPSKIGIKAVTYHQMKIVKKSSKVMVRFLLDL